MFKAIKEKWIINGVELEVVLEPAKGGYNLKQVILKSKRDLAKIEKYLPDKLKKSKNGIKIRRARKHGAEGSRDNG